MRGPKFICSIKFTVLASSVLPVVLLFLTLTTYFLIQRTQDVNDSLDVMGNTIADLVARASEYAIVSGNVDNLHAIITDQIRNAPVYSIAVVDAQGAVILRQYNAQLNPARIRRYATDVTLQQLPQDTFSLIEKHDRTQSSPKSRVLGSVTVLLTTQEAEKKQLSIISYGLLIGLLTTCLVGLLGLYIANTFIRNIEAIIAGVQRIRDGIYDQQIGTISQGNEIDFLAKNINATALYLVQMQAQIYKHMQEIVDEKEKSDYLVQVRTGELAVANENIRRLIQRTNVLIEEERKSIARDIHDHLNALVVAVRLEAQAILRILQRTTCDDPALPDIHTRINRMSSMINDVYAMGREIIRRLRPEVIDALGLCGAIRDLIESYDRVHPACQFNVVFLGNLDDLGDNIDMTIYRVIQEAMSNAIKYARAHKISIKLSCLQIKRDEVRLVIRDDGVGFNDEQQAQKGIGLISMRERVNGVGGKIEIKSMPGRGTYIVASIPILRRATD